VDASVAASTVDAERRRRRRRRRRKRRTKTLITRANMRFLKIIFVSASSYTLAGAVTSP
jgi:hypothetical protein